MGTYRVLGAKEEFKVGGPVEKSQKNVTLSIAPKFDARHAWNCIAMRTSIESHIITGLGLPHAEMPSDDSEIFGTSIRGRSFVGLYIDLAFGTRGFALDAAEAREKRPAYWAVVQSKKNFARGHSST